MASRLKSFAAAAASSELGSHICEDCVSPRGELAAIAAKPEGVESDVEELELELNLRLVQADTFFHA